MVRLRKNTRQPIDRKTRVPDLRIIDDGRRGKSKVPTLSKPSVFTGHQKALIRWLLSH
jgi:hypothetical protein